jgi:hypothetical protein
VWCEEKWRHEEAIYSWRWRWVGRPHHGPILWCSFLMPSHVESKQNNVPTCLQNDGGTRCKNKN